MKTPMTAWDLRQIADALEPLQDLPALRHPLIDRIEIRDDSGEVVGHFVPVGEGDDRWHGFEAQP